MRILDRTIQLAIILLLALSGWLLCGCVKAPIATEPSAPWPLMASGAHLDAQGRSFYGIGKAEGLHNPALLRASADNAAQAEMAHVLLAFTRTLAEASGVSTTEETDREAVAALARQAAKHAQIVEHHYDEASGALFALSRLSLTTFKKVLQGAAQFDPATQQTMISMAEAVHGRFMP